ncbi:MAG TPA: hypothetical protein VFJ01_02235 [Oleiagrimonas sp.]|nr:hypothetical protein [Oleiagrimonas sp.]
MRHVSLSLLSLLLLTPAVRASQPQTSHAAQLQHIMETTSVTAVMGLDGPSTKFKDDGDPNTLQIVFLSKKANGPSRVSPDGEVIFLYKASKAAQSKLIQKAFELRLAHATNGS